MPLSNKLTNSIVQEYDLENDCNESDAGVNDALCNNNARENEVNNVLQTNTATGSESANIDQENRVDSEDPDIPGLNQIRNTTNDFDLKDMAFMS